MESAIGGTHLARRYTRDRGRNPEQETKLIEMSFIQNVVPQEGSRSSPESLDVERLVGGVSTPMSLDSGGDKTKDACQNRSGDIPIDQTLTDEVENMEGVEHLSNPVPRNQCDLSGNSEVDTILNKEEPEKVNIFLKRDLLRRTPPGIRERRSQSVDGRKSDYSKRKCEVESSRKKKKILISGNLPPNETEEKSYNELINQLFVHVSDISKLSKDHVNTKVEIKKIAEDAEQLVKKLEKMRAHAGIDILSQDAGREISSNTKVNLQRFCERCNLEM